MVGNNLNTMKKNILIRPFIYKAESIGVESLKMILLLAVQIFMLFFTKSFSALLIIFSSTFASAVSLFENFPYLTLSLSENFPYLALSIFGTFWQF